MGVWTWGAGRRGRGLGTAELQVTGCWVGINKARTRPPRRRNLPTKGKVVQPGQGAGDHLKGGLSSPQPGL